ncbi:MAG TPA: SDR family oxidoreductase [Candidatus Acidoferrales bacterium]|nr:SDR family oxidoreductase [Candidatus Acidoferrales bacterium]
MASGKNNAPNRWAGKWALITGASAGIGQALAEQLASGGAHLVLTARRKDRLEKLAAKLRHDHDISVEIFVADLTDPTAPGQIRAFTQSKKIEIELLVNNAGFGDYGRFHETDIRRQLDMVQVNCAAVVHLTHLYLPDMVARRHGDILILASVAGFQAVPYISTYAATKAFDLRFAEGIAEEARRYGVHVCALCPGSTTTEFREVAGQPENTFRGAETAEKVARVGLRALAAGKSSVISGLKNNLSVEGQRLAPRRMVARVAAGMFEPKK